MSEHPEIKLFFTESLKTAKHWLEAWQGIILWLGILALSVFVAYCWAEDSKHFFNQPQAWQQLSMIIAICYLMFSVVLIVTFFFVFRGVKADEDKMANIFTYCYAYIIFASLASSLPFMLLPNLPDAVGNAMKISPIGIVRGCAKEGSNIPKEVGCSSGGLQWVVNIGGSIEPPTNADGRSEITGGLVVPLFVVILALMGAAVSMTRRVPEYQRRISPGDPEYLNYDQAREKLVFQIMQVASAPLIALTVYYTVNPDSRAGAIGLAFASGFSSETVLLLIRAGLEKLQPVPAAPTPSRQPVHVKISPARLDFGNVVLGSNSVKQISITNPTAVDLTVNSVGCTGEYDKETVALPLTVAAGESQALSIRFTPSSVGSKIGVLTITDNAPGSPRSIDLTGTGVN